jgi:CRP-like cAMP-binding protein
MALGSGSKNALSPEDRAVIRRGGLFSGVPEAALAPIVRHATVQAVPRGRVLFSQGDPAQAFFVVLDGWVKLFRLTSAGEEAIVGVFTRGQSFAEAVAFLGGTYPVGAEAVTDVRLLRFPSQGLIGAIRESPDIALAMLASTSRHLHGLVQQIEQLKARSATQRVAEFLVGLCPVAEGACTIGLPFDKGLIAGRLGMKPESLSRSFARLRPLGVRIDHATAAIGDVERLRAFAESGDAMERQAL